MEEQQKNSSEDKTIDPTDREELLSWRIEHKVYKKLRTNIILLATLISCLAGLGIFGYLKLIEDRLSNSIRSSVEATAEKEITKVSKSASKEIDEELKEISEKLRDLEEKLDYIEEKANKTTLEARMRLENTTDNINQKARSLIDDMERIQRETVSNLNEELEKFRKEQKESERRSKRILANVNKELQNLTLLTKVIRASLKKKIGILRNLSLNKAAPDAEIEKYIAILIFKELEDAELVKRQKVKNEATQIISKLVIKESLRDDFFTEVRFRIIRVVGELGLVNTACQQASDYNSWERGTFILMIGAMGDPRAIPTLIEIIKDTQDSVEVREKGIRALAAVASCCLVDLHGAWTRIIGMKYYAPAGGIKAFSPYPFYKGWEDREIEEMRPRSFSFYENISIKEDKFVQANEVVRRVLSSEHEAKLLRKAALRALFTLSRYEDIGLVKKVLINEWKDFGEDAIDFLADTHHEKSIDVLTEFIFMGEVDHSLRRKAIWALENIRYKKALIALKDISKRAKDNKVRETALEAIESREKEKK